MAVEQAARVDVRWAPCVIGILVVAACSSPPHDRRLDACIAGPVNGSPEIAAFNLSDVRELDRRIPGIKAQPPDDLDDLAAGGPAFVVVMPGPVNLGGKASSSRNVVCVLLADGPHFFSDVDLTGARP